MNAPNNPRHSAASVEHFTPAPVIAAARSVLGAIDLDPASCLIANEVVRAEQIYTAADDGLSAPWVGRIFLNPPGGKTNGESNQKRWCRRRALPPSALGLVAARRGTMAVHASLIRRHDRRPACTTNARRAGPRSAPGADANRVAARSAAVSASSGGTTSREAAAPTRVGGTTSRQSPATEA
jgi:hypothetical protein